MTVDAGRRSSRSGPTDSRGQRARARIARGDRGEGVEVRAHLGRGRSPARAPPVAARRAAGARRGSALRAVQDDADVQALAALDAGDDAQDRVLKGASAPGMLGLLGELPRRLQPAAQEGGHVGAAAAAGRRPASRRARRRPRRRSRPRARGASRASAALQRPGARRAGRGRRRGEGRARGGGQRVGAVLAVERRAVVDQPRAPVPDEQVRDCAACDRRSSRARRARRRRRRGRGRWPRAPAAVNGSAPGRKSTPRLSPALAMTRSWISGSGSASASSGATSATHELGDGQPERARQLAARRPRRRAPRGPGRRRGTSPRRGRRRRPRRAPGSEPPSRSGAT